MKKILFIFGTRPEAIKLAPLIREMKKQQLFNVKVCLTAQHREMLDQVVSFFKIKTDFDLNLMKKNQTIADVTSIGILKLDSLLKKQKPNLLVVQGDTTTAFLGALAGYYNKVPVAHIEAGLRTNDKFSPFPEELNRKLAGSLADLHFAPTPQAKQNLKQEGIVKKVWVVGNTVIDALLLGLSLNKKKPEMQFKTFFKNIDFSKKIILVTGHRRESFGKPFKEICTALKEIAQANLDVELVYPVHLNPNVQKPVYSMLKKYRNIHLIEPLDYSKLIWLMEKSFLVLTDSGGIQEEAPTLGKPVLVMRNVTERKEGVTAGTAKLVGTSAKNIVKETKRLLKNHAIYQKMARSKNPYGDGTAALKIVKVIKKTCA